MPVFSPGLLAGAAIFAHTAGSVSIPPAGEFLFVVRPGSGESCQIVNASEYREAAFKKLSAALYDMSPLETCAAAAWTLNRRFPALVSQQQRELLEEVENWSPRSPLSADGAHTMRTKFVALLGFLEGGRRELVSSLSDTNRLSAELDRLATRLSPPERALLRDFVFGSGSTAPYVTMVSRSPRTREQARLRRAALLLMAMSPATENTPLVVKAAFADLQRARSVVRQREDIVGPARWVGGMTLVLLAAHLARIARRCNGSLQP